MVPPLPSPPSPISKLSLFLSLLVCRQRGVEGVGEEPNHTAARKSGLLLIIQHSLPIGLLKKKKERKIRVEN